MNFIDIAWASGQEAAVEATAGTAQESLLATMGIDLKMFIFQLINFAIVFAILWFLILKPLTKKMAERQKAIDETLENTKKVELMLKKGERDYQSKIDDAKSEAANILETAKAEAKTEADIAKNGARTEIEKLTESAKHKITSEKELALSEIKNETADLIVAALEKILNEKITSEKDKKLITESLKKISG